MIRLLVVFLFLGKPIFAASPNAAASLFVRNPEILEPDDCQKSFHSHDPLLNELFLAHIRAFRQGMPGVGTAINRKFDGSFIFKESFAEWKEKLIAKFADESQSSPGMDLSSWLVAWEKMYTSNGLALAQTWVQGGRRRFLQKILLEMAFFAQKHSLFSSVAGRPAFWETDDDAKFFTERMGRAVEEAYGNGSNAMKAFQWAYNSYYLAHAHLRFPTASDHDLSTVTKVMRVHGIDYSKFFHPWKLDFAKKQIRKVETAHWTDIVQANINNKYYLPLVSLFSLDEEMRLVDRGNFASLTDFGSLKSFLDQVNLELELRNLAPIWPGPGVLPESGPIANPTWQKELMVQTALLQYYLFMNQVDETKLFTGFELGNAPDDIRSNPWIIDPSANALWNDARMTIQELNWIITLRLASTPTN